MEIRAGLTYVKHLGMLVGLVDGPILEKDVSSIKEDTIFCRLATKVLSIYIVTLDGQAALPLCTLPTNGITGDVLATKVNFHNFCFKT